MSYILYILLVFQTYRTMTTIAADAAGNMHCVSYILRLVINICHHLLMMHEILMVM